MIVRLCVAVIDKGQPDLERVNLSARCPILKPSLKTAGQGPRVFVVALYVDPLAQRHFNSGGRLKRRPAGALKTPGQTLFTIWTSYISDPLIVSKKAHRF